MRSIFFAHLVLSAMAIGAPAARASWTWVGWASSLAYAAALYMPLEVATELSKNGRSLTVIPGADFASAYFGLWLGDQPIDIRLRDDLRGGSPQRARTE